MKKKKDKLDRLTDKFKKASDKRLLQIKKKHEHWLKEEKAWQVFDKRLQHKIITVFRPVMEKLTGRLDKKLFTIKSSKLGSSSDTGESDDIESVREKHVYFWVSLISHTDERKACLFYGYQLTEETDQGFDEIYKLDEVNEKLITKVFLRAMNLISK